MLEKFKTYLEKNAQINDKQFENLSKHLKAQKVKKHTILLHPGEICGHSFFV
jgi:hypothetical protein